MYTDIQKWPAADAAADDDDDKRAVVFGSEQLHSGSELTVTDVGPHLSRLWSYQCSTTKGHNVSCIGWNATNLVRVPHAFRLYFSKKSQILEIVNVSDRGLVCGTADGQITADH